MAQDSKHPPASHAKLTGGSHSLCTLDTNSDINGAMKGIAFAGNSLDDLRAFPASAKQQAGYQMDRVQRGLDPADWKSMPSIGAGVREIRVRDSAGAFRVIYVATLPEAIYVLHAFQKKTQATAKADIDLATKRFKELTRSK